MKRSGVTTIYRTIINDLHDKIKAGDFSYDIPFCTEKSICETYNVSRITAKTAINNLAEMGLLYRKRGIGSFVAQRENGNGRPVVPGKGAYRTVALMMPFHMSKGGFFKSVEVATDALARHGVYFTLNIFEVGFENEQAMLQSLTGRDIDGIVYYPSSESMPTGLLDQFCERGKPILIIDKPHEYPQYTGIVSDNYRGGVLLTEHLISYGHANICYLSRFSAEDVYSIRDRHSGLRATLSENGIKEEPLFSLIEAAPDGSLDYPMLKHIINELYRKGITALVCENDEVAFHAYMCCQSLSIRIPEDMSVTGFDNISWATMGNTHITTIEQDFVQIGESIADLLLLPDYQPKHRVIPVRLIPRHSTGPR